MDERQEKIKTPLEIEEEKARTAQDHISPGDTQVMTFEKLGHQIGSEVAAENEAHGNSFLKIGDALTLMFPDGVQPDQYNDFLATARILDELFRLATDKDLTENPFRAIAGYGILGTIYGQTGQS